MTVKTRGIVLGQFPLKERDRRLTLLTEELGLVQAVARGARSKKGKLSSSAQLFAYSEFCLFEGKVSYTVDSADLIENFYDLRLSLPALSLASYLCEITRFILPDKETGPECLKLLLNTLWLLSRGKRPPELLKAIYELRLLSLSGFAPDLSGCRGCGEEGDLFFPLDGVLFCRSCAEKAPEGRLRYPLSPGALQAMRHICGAPEDRLFSFRLPPEDQRLLGEVTEGYLLCQTGGEFTSLNFLKSI